MCGKDHPMYGVPKSDLVKQRISDAKIGRKQQPRSVAACKNLSNALMGHSVSQTTRDKVGQANRKRVGEKRTLVTCPHCGKVGGAGVMARWHFDNCRTIELGNMGIG